MEPKLAVLGRLGTKVVGLGPKWSVLEGGQGREVAQASSAVRRWVDRLDVLDVLDPNDLKPSLDFFCRYMVLS